MSSVSGEFDHTTGQIRIDNVVQTPGVVFEDLGKLVIVVFSVTSEGETKDFEAAIRVISNEIKGADSHAYTITGQVIRLELHRNE